MSGLYDGIHSEIRTKYLQDRFPKLQCYPWSTQDKLVKILHDIYLDGGGDLVKDGGLSAVKNKGRISHSHYPGYCTLSAKWLESQFGPCEFNKIIENLRCLDVKQVYVISGWTMGYCLTEAWQKAFEDLYNISAEDLISFNRVIDSQGRPQRKPPNNNAIRSHDNQGNNAKTRAHIPFSIPVNQDCLRESFNYVKQLHDSILVGQTAADININKDRTNRIYQELWNLYHLTYSNKTPPGEVPQVYIEYDSGRLYGRGLSLQRCTREVKHAALAGLPLKELDISNCHYTILNQLAERCGVECPGFELYLDKKSEIRETLTRFVYSEEIEKGDISVEDAQKIIKECLIAPVNGAGTRNFKSRWWKHATGDFEPPMIILALSNGDQFNGIEKGNLLESHEVFRLITNDINKAVTTIIDSAQPVRSRGGIMVYRNEMGKCINPENKTRSQIISHFIRGVEAKILNTVLERFPGQIYVPMHDGFTANQNLDPRKLEKLITNITGFNVVLEEEVDYMNLDVELVKTLIYKRCSF